MFRYLSVCFITYFCWSFSKTTGDNLVKYSEAGDLATAERFIVPMWSFTIATMVMVIVLAIMVIRDLRKLGN
jgi:hypothetical protein